MNKALEGLVCLVGGVAAAVMPVTIDRTVNPAYAQSASPGPCIVNGRSLNNCIDLLYQRAEPADEIYPGARRVEKADKLASRFNFIYFTQGKWEKVFFDSGDTSQKVQRVFQEDSIVNYEALFNLFKQLQGKTERIVLTREGYMSVAELGNPKAYIIPISPTTVDKIDAL